MIGGVVGYSYQAENLCPSCTIKAMRANGIKVQRGKPHEDAIRRAAQNLNIDFDDQHAHDTDTFPKPLTKQQCETELTEVPDRKPGVRHAISDERCTGDKCRKWLVLGEKSPTEAGLIRWVRDEYELPQELARATARKLREWGLSHPEFVTEDNVRQATAMSPHDYATIADIGHGRAVNLALVRTPECDGDPCFYCEQPWEKHVFTCETCGIDVLADAAHAHQEQVKGQLKFSQAKPTT